VADSPQYVSKDPETAGIPCSAVADAAPGRAAADKQPHKRKTPVAFATGASLLGPWQ